MQRREEALSTAFPGCVLTAMEMLGVVTQIIAYAGHDPEHVFANCDHCLSIVRNVRDALGWLKSETPLTHKAYVQAYEADEEGGARPCIKVHSLDSR